MARYDFNAPRLYLDAPLQGGARITLDRAQANYLLNVLRLKSGDAVLVFNERDGEWRARIAPDGRKSADLVPEERLRAPEPGPDLVYAFAPLKHARLDYVVQKAVEMGARRLQPTLTRRTQAARINLERMRANVIEAAEQCGIVALPEVAAEAPLEGVVADFEPERLVIFCDEDAPVRDPLEALAAAAGNPTVKLAVVVGPEGGFTEEERALVLRHPRVARLSLGPRILRADTAAVAALALVQAALGDWR